MVLYIQLWHLDLSHVEQQAGQRYFLRFGTTRLHVEVRASMSRCDVAGMHAMCSHRTSGSTGKAVASVSASSALEGASIATILPSCVEGRRLGVGGGGAQQSWAKHGDRALRLCDTSE